MTASDGTYGVPRVTAELKDAGRRVNHKRVERVMRTFRIVGLHLCKKVRTTIPEPSATPVPDLLRRDFTAQAPKLPESFYALTELEDVTIDFGLLDPPVRQRLAALARSEPDNPARDWIRAVQVKLLLKADRTDDAYQAANRILARRPDFCGLADVAATVGYWTWRGDAA